MNGPSLRVTYADGRKPVEVQFPPHTDPFQILERAMKQFPAAPVAQTAERGARNSEVVGSNPTGGSRPSGVRDTSMVAYSAARASGKLTTQQGRVYDLFKRDRSRNWTRSEVANAIGMRINSCTGRINEMIAEPWPVLEECGKRRCAVTGETVNQLRLKC